MGLDLCVERRSLTIVTQIVKRQCWLNEILRGHAWTPESSDSPSSKGQTVSIDEDQADETDLQAVLTGLTPACLYSVSCVRTDCNYRFLPANPDSRQRLLPTGKCLKLRVPV